MALDARALSPVGAGTPRRAAQRAGTRRPCASPTPRRSLLPAFGTKLRSWMFVRVAKFGMGENGMLSLPAPPPT